ncbi:MAG: radical SAM protein [Candidatus Azobacteroides sp.]|nr:radical SAM protein [Candidatus Azobacteroides sp.]
MQTKINDFTAFFEKDYPLIKLFEYDSDILIYDAKPHFAFIVSYNEMDVLIDFLNGKSNEEIIKIDTNFDKAGLSALLNRYQELLDCGVFIKGPVDEISPVDKAAIEDIVNYYNENILLRKFCLEVTEDCNYRCKYCPNTLAKDYRQHTKTYMSFEVAKESIDYYFRQYVKVFNKLNDQAKALILDIASPTLSWYGGEPLLNFDVIVNSAEYFKTLPWHLYGIPNDQLKFSMNTNLSIMNEDILKFLVENDVILFVSLDGPKEEHDKCRVFTNGKGTFDVAYANLIKMRDYNPEYYKRKIMIFGVYTDSHDFEKCKKFLENQNALGFRQFPADYKGIFVKNAEGSLEALHQNYKKRLEIEKRKIDSFSNFEEEKTKYKDIFDFIDIHVDNPNGKNKLNLLLTCPMAYDNLMAGSDGVFHICHKTDGSMPVGNCTEGVKFDKVVDLFRDYNEIINNDVCKSCWSVHFCKVCSAPRRISNKFINPTIMECEFMKMNAAFNFELFIYLYLNYPQYYQTLVEFKNDKKSNMGIIDINHFIY